MKSILVVDDNKLNLATARTVLINDYKVIPVMKGQQALTYLESGECDIVLLDINMPDMNGFEVLEKIRSMERYRNIPVIFLTGDNDAETETRCFKEGAVDFIAKPFVPEVMLSRIGRALELEELRRSLAYRLEQKTREVSAIKDMAQQDALTGLWDRVYTEDTVNELLERSATGALMMIDIDNFKSINDSYGHDTGDKVLIMLADTLRDQAAEEDVLCRLGGDEFVVFMKNASSKAYVRSRAAGLIAELHDRMETFGFEVDTSISIGIAQAPEDGTEFNKLYNCADKALYHVKRNGKNSFHFFSDRLEDESERGSETVDLKYLQELMRRTDGGKGAYLLDIESFKHVYNFIQRYVDCSNRDVSALLFTLSESGNTKAMEALEKTICTSMRRSDVATRYSSKQLIALLVDAGNESSAMAAQRIIEGFYKLYTDRTVQIDYSIVRMDSRQSKKASDAPDGQ
ncbi:MAG: diguanylate cyclase [Christensenellaceae bacterium]|nr:diguanylate cyclase [Christensenellaceae bacterium]